jgi:hypothetical protein
MRSPRALLLLLGLVGCAMPVGVPRAPSPTSDLQELDHQSPCQGDDSSGLAPVNYGAIAGLYDLFVVSGSDWHSGFPPDSGSLLITVPSADVITACGSRLSCRPLPIAGTNIRMHVEGATAWVREPWKEDSSMQAVYVSLASASDSIWLALGSAFDDVVMLKGRIKSGNLMDGTWFSIIGEVTRNRGRWCAIRRHQS